MRAQRGGVARCSPLLSLLLLLALLAPASAQGGEPGVSLTLAYQVLPTGFVRLNVTMAFLAPSNASAPIPSLELRLPEAFSAALPPGPLSWSFSVRGPVPVNVSAQAGGPIALRPGPGLLPPSANESVSLSFFLRGAGGLLRPLGGQNMSLALPLPSLSPGLELRNFTLSLALPQGVSALGVNFTKVSQLPSGSVYSNSTGAARLLEPRLYNLTLQLGSGARLSALRFPEVIRKVQLNGTAQPFIEDVILIQNLGGTTLTSLPLNLPPDVATLYLPAPPGPIPGSSASASLTQGELDLAALGRSIAPGSSERLTLHYYSPSLFTPTPWGFSAKGLAFSPVQGIVDNFTLAVAPAWASRSAGLSLQGLSPLAVMETAPLLLQPGLASPASQLQGLWALILVALWGIHLALGRVIREESPLRRAELLLSLLKERAKLDRGLLTALASSSAKGAPAPELLELYSQLAPRREALLRRLEELREALGAMPELKGYRAALAQERQEEKAIRDLISLLRRGGQGLIRGEAFRRELEAGLRRGERQLAELEEELKKVGPVGSSS